MDPASLVLPGAQALVTQILSHGWTQARAWLARRLSRPGGASESELEQRLNAARAQADALTVPDGTDAPGRRALLEAYWAGYLAALVGEHPEIASVLAELAVPVGGGPASRGIINSLTGTVTGNVVQAGTIEGGVRFG